MGPKLFAELIRQAYNGSRKPEYAWLPYPAMRPRPNRRKVRQHNEFGSAHFCFMAQFDCFDEGPQEAPFPLP